MANLHNESPRLGDILTSHLLNYTNKITFPWPVDSRLNASEVGRVFFGKDYDATKDWSTVEVKEALKSLSFIGIHNLTGEDIFQAIRDNLPPDHTVLDEWQNTIGLVLLLDQGSRNLCKKGTNGRYIYHYFDVLSLYIVMSGIESNDPIFNIAAWEKECGISPDQAVLRILMLLAPLAHSENLIDQETQLHLTETLRSSYEERTSTRDPHRATFEEDKRDVYLLTHLLDAGPPQGDRVTMPDFVYWLMRYYTAHIAYVQHFARSPFRNVAVGRADADGEVEWLSKNGVRWDACDEKTRESVREDINNGVWTALDLS